MKVITARNICWVSIMLLFFCPAAVSAQKGFMNPLLTSGPDPWCLYKDGMYYYMHTTGHDLRLWKTKDITALSRAASAVIWTPPATGPMSRDIWAPEIHFLQGKWYVYFAADNGDNYQHRLYVLENASADPLQGQWIMKGELKTPGDKWAIDGSVFEDHGQLYLIWSGWQGEKNGEQDIFISRMKNPWTTEGERVMLSAPEYDWEKNGEIKEQGKTTHLYVNEGPELLKHGKDLFLVYSASACWMDTYSLGMLRAKSGSDLMQPSSWKKSAQPVFQQSLKNQVYATGHCSFFMSPNGKENYILYHANSQPGEGCGKSRSPRAQRFSWKRDGNPSFGEPIADGVLLPLPSGTVSDR